MNESDTPETDAVEQHFIRSDKWPGFDFARTTERRCAELTKIHVDLAEQRDFVQDKLKVSEARCAELTAALELQTRINRQACVDWADDDTAIKAACKPFGIDTEGDSYGVPTMVDCVLKLAARCAELEAALKAK